MGAIIALFFLLFIGMSLFGVPIIIVRELARMAADQKRCVHADGDGTFCPDCGDRIGRVKSVTGRKEVPAPPPAPPAKQEQTQAATRRPDAVTEAVLDDLALGLKDLGFDKATAKRTVERLRPMAQGGATLNQLINEALKR